MAFVKKLDTMLIKSFIPPFFATFMIAIFVLIMQTLWMYIDDIAGKGVGMLLLVELLAYRSVSLVPLALPIAVLISSVMVLGNLGERYELSSIKSAGVSLFRIMRPLLFLGFVAALFSYFCAVFLIPEANLKFGSRMYDITHQKPTLRLQVGVFNDDFNGYAIRIGEKGQDGKTIKNVLIYDHKEAAQGRLSKITAESGEMYSTEDGKYFVMNLHNGYQYIEPKPSRSGASFPFIRTAFDNWTKIFDLGEFQLKRTNEELFKHNRSMLSVGELNSEIDSFDVKISKAQTEMSNSLANYFTLLDLDSTYIKIARVPAILPSGLDTTTKNAIIPKALKKDSSKKTTASSSPSIKKMTNKIKANLTSEKKSTKKVKPKVSKNRFRKNKIPKQSIEKPLNEYQSITEIFPGNDQKNSLSKALNSAKSIRSRSGAAIRRLDHLKEDQVKHVYDLHTKYSMAVACFIFMFIGAPMGAIVRKGGFGYPLLVAIIFFMIFVVLTIFCRKIAESFVVSAYVAAWIPCMVLFPIGVILTIKAMNDSRFEGFRLPAFVTNLFKKKAE